MSPSRSVGDQLRQETGDQLQLQLGRNCTVLSSIAVPVKILNSKPFNFPLQQKSELKFRGGLLDCNDFAIKNSRRSTFKGLGTCPLLSAPAHICDISNNVCKVIKINKVKMMPHKTICLDWRSSYSRATMKFNHSYQEIGAKITPGNSIDVPFSANHGDNWPRNVKIQLVQENLGFGIGGCL
ncbi:hypothetical protein OROMI_031109 [Orobanche minor]